MHISHLGEKICWRHDVLKFSPTSIRARLNHVCTHLCDEFPRLQRTLIGDLQAYYKVIPTLDITSQYLTNLDFNGQK